MNSQLMESIKKKSTESVGACQVHMEKVSKDKMQQRLVDKEQPDADTWLSINYFRFCSH